MTTVLWYHFPLGGVNLGGTHGLVGPQDDFFDGRCFTLYIEGGGSRQRSAVETQRPMRGDGLAQEDVVWNHGGVDGREAWQGRCISFCSEHGLVEDGGDDT